MVFKELCSKTKINTSQLAKKWDVSIRTAKRDLSLLQENKKIKFVGPIKYGKYSLV